MYANAFKSPFDFDVSKIAGAFNFPMVNVETVVETGRKNFAAFTTASTATVEEKAAKQIDFAKKSYEAAIANTKELTDLYTKGQTEAFETLNARIAELTEEVKAALAAKK